MIENNPLPPQKNENWERTILISTYNREVKRAISDCDITSFLVAIPCALSSYNCMCYLLEGGWRLLCAFALALSGIVCFRIAKGRRIQRVRKRWHYPQKSSGAEWERDAAKQFDDALASCTLTLNKRPIHIIIKTIVIASVLASVLFGVHIYLDPPEDHPGSCLLVFAAFVVLVCYYGDGD